MSAVAAATPLRHDVGVLEPDVSSPDLYAARLYERHNRAIFRLCLKELRAREDADDAVQTTFVYALMSLRRGVVPQLELPWLLTIARNVCSTRRRSGTRRRLHEATQDLDSLQDRLPTPDRSDVATTEDFTMVLRAIPESQRKALLLREWKGLSYDEIGSELGLSQAATEALLFRARQNVAQRLGARVGLKSLNGLPLLSFLRGLFQSAAGKAIALGAGAALTVVAVPAAQPDVGSHAVRTPAPQIEPRMHAQTDVSAPRVAGSPTVSRSVRPAATRTAPGRTVPDVGAPRLRPDVAPVSSAHAQTPPPSVPSTAADVTLPTAPVNDVVDTVAAATSELGLPPISVPDVSVQLPAVQAPAVPSLPSVHVP